MIQAHYDTVKRNIGPGVQLCAVTKRRSLEEILSLYEAGERIFAENRADELIARAEALPKDIQWHFIGHLQRNKVRRLLPYVSMIQSLDSIALAEEIEKEAARLNRIVPVLAEFHLALEDTGKSGLSPDQAEEVFDRCFALAHLRPEGIMVMGPHGADQKRIAEVFTAARRLYESLQERYGSDIRILSMGMSSDYETAVSCGSNMVRIGTYLFEE